MAFDHSCIRKRRDRMVENLKRHHRHTRRIERAGWNFTRRADGLAQGGDNVELGPYLLLHFLRSHFHLPFSLLVHCHGVTIAELGRL